MAPEVWRIAKLFALTDFRPRRMLAASESIEPAPHAVGECDEVETVIVRRDDLQSFFDALDRRTALTRLYVMQADAVLQKDANEVRLVPHTFEEEILELFARF